MRADRLRLWTPYENEFLRANYHDLGRTVCADRLGRTIKAVEERARVLGIAKPRAPQRSTPRHIGPREELTPPPDHPAVLKPEAPRTSAVYDSGFIRPPSLKRLMSGKA